jgi:hypothetical protein
MATYSANVAQIGSGTASSTGSGGIGGIEHRVMWVFQKNRYEDRIERGARVLKRVSAFRQL